MGGVVKAVTKPFKSITKGLTKAVGGLLGGAPEAPQIIQVPSTAPVQNAVAVADAPVEKPDMESESGATNETAGRKGKKSLTVRRTSMGGGSGLNM